MTAAHAARRETAKLLFGACLAAVCVHATLACGSGDDGATTPGDAGTEAGSTAGAGGSSTPGSGGQPGSGGTTASAGSGGAGASGGTGGATSSAGSGGATSSGGAGGASNGGTGGRTGAGGSVAPGAVDCLADGNGRTELAFVNGCTESITFRGSDIQNGTLAPGAFQCVDIGSTTEALSAKRYWGFTGEDPGAEHHTLAEFTFNTNFNDFDWYNISHVDAFNLPMRIVPLARPRCQTLVCAMNLLEGCPDAGLFRNATGEVVACVSPNRDDPNGAVPLHFEQCDDAYAWSGDDQQGSDPSPVRACAGEDWEITFCPGGAP